MNSKSLSSHNNIQITLKLISFFMILICSSCVRIFENSPSIPFVLSDEIYKDNHSFLYPANNLHQPYISPNERWFIYSYIEPRHGERTLLYSSTSKQEKRPVPLPQSQYSKEIRIGSTIDKWSPSGDLFAFDVDIDYQNYIAVVRFSSEEAQLIDFFKADTDYYWYGNDKLSYLDHMTGDNSIVVKNYSKNEIDTISTGIKAATFKVSNNGIFISSRRIFEGYELYLGNLNDERPIPLRKIFQEFTIVNYQISPDGKHALLVSPNPDDTTSLLWALVDLKNLSVIHRFPELNHYEWSPDGSKLAYGKKGEWVPDPDPKNKTSKKYSFDHNFYVFDLATAQENNHGIGINDDDFVWDPKGEYIISTNRYTEGYSQSGVTVMDSGIYIFRIKDGKEIGCVSDVKASPLLTSISNNGGYILWSHEDHTEDEYKIFIVHNQFKERMYPKSNENNITSH